MGEVALYFGQYPVVGEGVLPRTSRVVRPRENHLRDCEADCPLHLSKVEVLTSRSAYQCNRNDPDYVEVV